MILSCADRKILSEAEQTAIDYINKNINDIKNLTITDIAEASYVSSATISRAIRKCGYESMSELKYALTHKRNDTNLEYRLNEILSRMYRECVDTIHDIDIDAVRKIVQMIDEAKRVLLIANGLTIQVAQEIEIFLQYQGIYAWCITDDRVMREISHVITSKDLLIVVSTKNTMPNLSVAASQAKEIGAKVATLTCTRGTTLEEYSDVVVYGCATDLGEHMTIGTKSRIGLFIVSRTITEYLYLIKND